ncbi:MAG: hypothetical protein H7X99_07540 [Saprospiraceae bacterium]|nr:hypothetical protein [Saprospiraceae bacterium]
MKKYVKAILSFMVTGLFLVMAVASLDPLEDYETLKDCTLFPQPKEQAFAINILVTEQETKLPAKDVDIYITYVSIVKEMEDDTCAFKKVLPDSDGGRTDSAGKFLSTHKIEYNSADDYTFAKITVQKNTYYEVERDVVLKYGTLPILETFYLLNKTKTP